MTRQFEGYWLYYPSGFRTHISQRLGDRLLMDPKSNVRKTGDKTLELYEYANDPGYELRGRKSGKGGPTVIQRVRIGEGRGPLQRKSA